MLTFISMVCRNMKQHYHSQLPFLDDSWVTAEASCGAGPSQFRVGKLSENTMKVKGMKEHPSLEDTVVRLAHNNHEDPSHILHP